MSLAGWVTRVERCQRDHVPLEVTPSEYRELLGMVGVPFGVPVVIAQATP